ncbi:hypothetical protein ACWHA1_28370 [Streptomyces decoyicus]
MDECLTAGGVEGELRGALALAGAYGRLDSLGDCPEPDDMDEDIDPAVELLREAEANGVDEGETSEPWWYSERMRSRAAGLRDYLAETDAYVEKHGPTPWGRLEAKLAHCRGAKIPLTMHSWQLAEMLLGTGVPDSIEVIIYAWLEAAEEAGTSEVAVTEDQHRIFELALAGVEGFRSVR